MSGEYFTDNYFSARDRFRAAAKHYGWICTPYAIPARGPGGEELTLDVATAPATASATAIAGDLAVVVSSGLHGVEGPLGAAVQCALFERWAQTGGWRVPGVRYVFLHALNPHGWAWQRRFNEENVDPNRNFLCAGEEFRGCSPGYAALDGLLNPKYPPRVGDGFHLRALWAIARQGMPAVKEAVASGQYEFPRGLFFGGHAPCASQLLLRQHLPAWVGEARHVVHIDFHTGLGRWGSHKLLLDAPVNDNDRQWLTRTYGAREFEISNASGVAYSTRGGLGSWLVSQMPGRRYLYVCAEFGTYGPLRILAGLRAENQAHLHCEANDSRRRKAKARLCELFCPAAFAWRQKVAAAGIDLVERALTFAA